MKQVDINKILREHEEWLNTGGMKGKIADLRGAILPNGEIYKLGQETKRRRG